MNRIATLIFFALIVFAVFPANAQPALQPTNLAVEVYYYPKEAPAYLVVSPTNSRPGHAFYGRFKRTPDWKEPAGSMSVSAIDIKVLLNNAGGVTAIVSVLKGKLLQEQESVGSYTIREREKVRVEELTKFGVEPFELSLVRVSASGVVPIFVSESRAIELVSIEPILATLPTYRLVLRNVSSKDIAQLRISAGPVDQPHLSAQREGKEGAPLIRAGGTVELTMRTATRAVPAPGGFTPFTPAGQEIRVSTVIYGDGTYDGDAEDVAQFRAVKVAKRIQLTRTAALFRDALANQQTSEAVLPSLLRRVEQLSTEVDPTDVENILRDFPTVAAKRNELRDLIEIELRQLKKDAAEEVRDFQGRGASAGAFTNWLELSAARYEEWVARLG